MNVKHALAIPAALLASATTLAAQDPPFRAKLRGTFSDGTQFSDVWGEGNVALVAHIGQSLINIVDVSNPDDPTFLTTWTVPPPSFGASAQDVKAENGLMYVCLDSNTAESVEIVDIRDPANPAHLSWVRINGLTRPHNIFVDQGWLFIAPGAGQEIGIVDLTSYDPDNPPVRIETPKYYVSGLGSVHDVTVQNGLMYISDIGPGVPNPEDGSYRVYDVSDLANTAPSFLGTIEGGRVHSSWPTGDDAYSVSADEDWGGPIKLFEHVDQGTSIDFIQRDSWVNPLSGIGASGNPHNPVFFENRLYIANNAGGALVLQLDRTSNTLEQVASYDTSTIVPATYFGEGCWGMYPFFGHETVLVSDRQNGLFVVDFSGLELAFPSPRPDLLAPGSDATIDITIDPLGTAVLDASSVTLHTSVNDGTFQTSAMSSTGGNGWQGTFPSLSCGDKISWYVSAQDTLGETYTRPGLAPTDVYRFFVSSGLTGVLVDDFETDMGWTASTVGAPTSGEWQRGVPVDNGAQPPSDDPDSAGTQCYVTEIGSGGFDDVDGGTVRLTSPVMDFSGFDGVISYLRWYLNTDADGPEGEPFVVEISNDAGGSWTTVESVTRDGGGWSKHAFRISDFVPPTAQMQVRFSASDDPDDSTCEAGVDNFRAERFECALTLASATFRNGTSVNRSCYASTNAPVLGGFWNATVDTTGHAGAVLTELYLYALPATGPVLPYGEVLIDLGSPRFFRDSEAVTQTVNPHANFIPYDVSFVGASTASQAVILGGGVELCNAQDLVVGF